MLYSLIIIKFYDNRMYSNELQWFYFIENTKQRRKKKKEKEKEEKSKRNGRNDVSFIR